MRGCSGEVIRPTPPHSRQKMGHPDTLAKRLALLVHNRIDDSPNALMVLYGASVAALWLLNSASVAAQ